MKASLVLCSIASLLTTSVQAANVNLTKVLITGPGIDETAVCNDGSPASYGWKRSPIGSNKWLVMM